jgi:hypothetical protein
MLNTEGLLKYERHDWFEVADVANVVLTFLGPDELRSCSCVNRLLHDLADEDDLWVPLLEQEYLIRYKPKTKRRASDEKETDERDDDEAESGRSDAKGNLRRRRRSKSDSAALKQETSLTTDSGSTRGAKAVFHKEWKKPRSEMLMLMRRMRNAVDVTDYFRLSQAIADGYTGEFEDLRSYFDETAANMHKKMTRWSIRHQIGATLTSLGGIAALAWWCNSGDQTGSWWASLLDSLHPLESLKSTFSNRSNWLTIGTGVFLGLSNRRARKAGQQKKASLSGRTGAPVSTASLPPKERALVCVSYALKALNDTLFSSLLVPPLLVGIGSVTQQWGTRFLPPFLLRLLGGASFFAIGIASVMVFKLPPPIPVAASLAYGLALALKVPFVPEITAGFFRFSCVGLSTMVLCTVLTQQDYYLKSRGAHDGRRGGSFQSRQIRSAIGIAFFFGWIRFLLADTWPTLLWLFSFLPIKVCFAGSTATQAPHLGGIGLDHIPLADAVGYYWVAALLMRLTARRVANMLYSSRWHTKPYLALCMDLVAVRVLIDQGFGAALTVRVLSTLAYVLATG